MYFKRAGLAVTANPARLHLFYILLLHYEVEHFGLISCPDGEQIHAVGEGVAELHLFIDASLYHLRCAAVYHLAYHVCYLKAYFLIIRSAQRALHCEQAFVRVWHQPDVAGAGYRVNAKVEYRDIHPVECADVMAYAAADDHAGYRIVVVEHCSIGITR